MHKSQTKQASGDIGDFYQLTKVKGKKTLRETRLNWARPFGQTSCSCNLGAEAEEH